MSSASPPVDPIAPAGSPGPQLPPPRRAGGRRLALRLIAAALVLLLLAVAIGMAWRTQQRLQNVEQELVKRQKDSHDQAMEARLLARQAQDSARDASAKVALLEARFSEVSVQRDQIDDLIALLSRSREENVAVELEAGIRVALQHSAITGSAGPLVAALTNADERLARVDQPRFEAVRRAIARDLGRVKSVGVSDIATLNVKLDEAVRMVDDLPLLSAPRPRRQARKPANAASVPAAAASAIEPARDWPWLEPLNRMLAGIWDEARSLVRISPIKHPESMLLAPEQGLFLRENLKLRLLNARLAVLSRQFDLARHDLQGAQTAIERYFDRDARQTAALLELIHQVRAQARDVALPRPDETLAALSAAIAGR